MAILAQALDPRIFTRKWRHFKNQRGADETNGTSVCTEKCDWEVGGVRLFFKTSAGITVGVTVDSHGASLWRVSCHQPRFRETDAPFE